MTDTLAATSRPRATVRQRVAAGCALVALALGAGVALTYAPAPDGTPLAEMDPTSPPPTNEDSTSLLEADAASLAGALEQVHSVADGYPDYLYWFQVDDLGVTFFDTHRLAAYTVAADRESYTACLTSLDTGEWALWDSTAAAVTGTGATAKNDPAPACVADGEPKPSARALAMQGIEVDAASVGDLIRSYNADTDMFPTRSDLNTVVKGFIAPTTRLVSYTSTAAAKPAKPTKSDESGEAEGTWSVCLSDRTHDTSAAYRSWAKAPVTTYPTTNCKD